MEKNVRLLLFDRRCTNNANQQLKSLMPGIQVAT